MINNIINYLKDKKILILGFGREGKSSYNFIRKNLPDKEIFIGDQNPIELNDDKVTLVTGDNYLDSLDDYDLIIKTPGISFKDVKISKDKITSQLELFLNFIPNKIIGITGTKGKSTTSSMIYKVLKEQNKDVLLLGNIGVPLLDMISDINSDTILVIEMSSHQLEFVDKSPYISILTNLYQEHLDHYNSYDEYINAKLNICKYQTKDNYFIYNKDDQEILKRINNINSNMIGVSKNDNIPNVENDKLMGDSSKYNILFTLEVAKLFNLDLNKTIESINSFNPLPHRIEYVGEYNNIKFYDDAIATIPEACINSIKALKNVDTLIFGGLDRGVNLTSLEEYLNQGVVKNLICMPETGYIIADTITNKDINIFKVETMEEAVDIAFNNTKNICLLAPAAASYNRYKNFEEKGNHYQELIKNHK